jgi:hypothetical protein
MPQNVTYADLERLLTNLGLVKRRAFAKQIDELLFRTTGKHLAKDDFEALSGEAVINRSKKRYEDTRRDAGKDSKS